MSKKKEPVSLLGGNAETDPQTTNDDVTTNSSSVEENIEVVEDSTNNNTTDDSDVEPTGDDAAAAAAPEDDDADGIDELPVETPEVSVFDPALRRTAGLERLPRMNGTTKWPDDWEKQEAYDLKQFLLVCGQDSELESTECYSDAETEEKDVDLTKGLTRTVYHEGEDYELKTILHIVIAQRKYKQADDEKPASKRKKSTSHPGDGARALVGEMLPFVDAEGKLPDLTDDQLKKARVWAIKTLTSGYDDAVKSLREAAEWRRKKEEENAAAQARVERANEIQAHRGQDLGFLPHDDIAEDLGISEWEVCRFDVQQYAYACSMLEGNNCLPRPATKMAAPKPGSSGLPDDSFYGGTPSTVSGCLDKNLLTGANKRLAETRFSHDTGADMLVRKWQNRGYALFDADGTKRYSLEDWDEASCWAAFRLKALLDDAAAKDAAEKRQKAMEQALFGGANAKLAVEPGCVADEKDPLFCCNPETGYIPTNSHVVANAMFVKSKVFATPHLLHRADAEVSIVDNMVAAWRKMGVFPGRYEAKTMIMDAFAAYVDLVNNGGAANGITIPAREKGNKERYAKGVDDATIAKLILLEREVAGEEIVRVIMDSTQEHEIYAGMLAQYAPDAGETDRAPYDIIEVPDGQKHSTGKVLAMIAGYGVATATKIDSIARCLRQFAPKRIESQAGVCQFVGRDGVYDTKTRCRYPFSRETVFTEKSMTAIPVDETAEPDDLGGLPVVEPEEPVHVYKDINGVEHEVRPTGVVRDWLPDQMGRKSYFWAISDVMRKRPGKAPTLIGEGEAGKTAAAKIIESIMGRGRCGGSGVAPYDFGNPDEMMGLKGCPANICYEAGEGYLTGKALDLFKTAITEQVVSVVPKWKCKQDLRLGIVHVFVMNDAMPTAKRGREFRRRLYAINFDKAHYDVKIPGIVNDWVWEPDVATWFAYQALFSDDEIGCFEELPDNEFTDASLDAYMDQADPMANVVKILEPMLRGRVVPLPLFYQMADKVKADFDSNSRMAGMDAKEFRQSLIKYMGERGWVIPMEKNGRDYRVFKTDGWYDFNDMYEIVYDLCDVRTVGSGDSEREELNPIRLGKWVTRVPKTFRGMLVREPVWRRYEETGETALQQRDADEKAAKAAAKQARRDAVKNDPAMVAKYDRLCADIQAQIDAHGACKVDAVKGLFAPHAGITPGLPPEKVTRVPTFDEWYDACMFDAYSDVDPDTKIRVVDGDDGAGDPTPPDPAPAPSTPDMGTSSPDPASGPGSEVQTPLAAESATETGV